jgi:hypothetical protein
MAEMDRFVNGNISCFSDQLRYETIPANQELLKRLLIEEENRFGATDDRLRMVERKLADGAEILARQRRLIAEIQTNGGDSGRAEQVLVTSETIQHLFEGFRARIHDERERQRP